MSNWKVFKTKIRVFPFPDPETTDLELGVAGNYPVVVRKGTISDLADVVFIPEKSVLSGDLLEEFSPWLAGKSKNRVKQKRIRGQESAGIVLSPEHVGRCGVDISAIPYDTDVSELFGVTRYVPQVPQHLDGVMVALPEWVREVRHDVERHSAYVAMGAYSNVTRVVVTEKIHGSQINFFTISKSEAFVVSTKNKLEENLCFAPDCANGYIEGAENARLKKIIDESFPPGTHVQIVGELVPVAGGYSYGFEKRSVMVFLVLADGVQIPYDKVPDRLRELWVPVLYDGDLSGAGLSDLRSGHETVSGNKLHIREGVVVTPYDFVRAPDGFRLYTKVINPAYKDTGEELS